MNKAQKELIQNAKPYKLGNPLTSLYIIPTGKKYNGFWGKNGFNDIKIVGLYDGVFYIVNREYQSDVINFYRLKEIAAQCCIDVPEDLNCVRLFFDCEICFRMILSSLVIELYKELAI